MHNDKMTIQKSVKHFLTRHTNEAQEVHVFTESLEEHMSPLHQKQKKKNDTENI